MVHSLPLGFGDGLLPCVLNSLQILSIAQVSRNSDAHILILRAFRSARVSAFINLSLSALGCGHARFGEKFGVGLGNSGLKSSILGSIKPIATINLAVGPCELVPLSAYLPTMPISLSTVPACACSWSHLPLGLADIVKRPDPLRPSQPGTLLAPKRSTVAVTDIGPASASPGILSFKSQPASLLQIGLVSLERKYFL